MFFLQKTEVDGLELYVVVVSKLELVVAENWPDGEGNLPVVRIVHAQRVEPSVGACTMVGLVGVVEHSVTPSHSKATRKPRGHQKKFLYFLPTDKSALLEAVLP